jgi:hypothetical protein
LRVAVQQDLELKTKNRLVAVGPPQLHLTVTAARAVLIRLRADQPELSRAASPESVIEIPGLLDLPDNNTQVPDSPVSSIEVYHDARPTSSPAPSTGSAPLAEIAETDVDMTNTDTTSKRTTVNPMRSIDTHVPAQDALSKLTWDG